MKAYDEVDAKIHLILLPVLYVEISASDFGPFTPGESVPML
jgi:hypothetical protein